MNVLMLGWEFPPLFSGGLGVATYGLVKALRASTSITLIVPRSDPSGTLGKVQIIGVSNALKEELNREGTQHSLAALAREVEQIPLSISPYGFLNQILETEETSMLLEDYTSAEPLYLKLSKYFEGPEAYGSDIHRKVHLFSHL